MLKLSYHLNYVDGCLHPLKKLITLLNEKEVVRSSSAMLLSSRAELPWYLFFFLTENLFFFKAENTLKSYICSGSLKMKVEGKTVNISLSYENILFHYVKKWLQKAKIWEASWDVIVHAFIYVSYLSVIYWPLCFTLLKLCFLSAVLVITEELPFKWINSLSSRWLMKSHKSS